MPFDLLEVDVQMPCAHIMSSQLESSSSGWEDSDLPILEKHALQRLRLLNSAKILKDVALPEIACFSRASAVEFLGVIRLDTLPDEGYHLGRRVE